jgi:NADPH:quinone reductase-like Zn-dependent oxidoreductase
VIPGHDFAGTVASIFTNGEAEHGFKPGDEVYGMTDGQGPGSTWAEYAVIRANEVARKLVGLNFAESATMPMSAPTALQALFVQARAPEPDFTGETTSKRDPPTKVLITGASGAVGIYLV